jgi:hypothetical protein
MLRQPPDKLQNRDFDFFFFAGSVVFKVSRGHVPLTPSDTFYLITCKR